MMNTLIGKIKKENFDGFNVLSQALLYGAKVKVMPGQLIMVEGEGESDKHTAFVHSVALSTRLSTVTFVLQKRFRRAIHQRRGVPVPTGATFSYFAQLDPVKYANKIGYPVVVKEVFGENPSFSVYDVNNKKQLASAIKKVKAHLPTSSSEEPASYAQTINLSSAEVEGDGSRTKSDKARFLIEKQVVGDHYRIYIVEGKFVLALLRNGRKSIETTPPKLVRELSERAVNAISGLANGSVDIVYDRISEEAYVVELCERIIIPDDCQDTLTVCDKIFSNLFLSEVKRANIKLRRKKGESTYEISFQGITNSTYFLESLSQLASDINAELSIRHVDEVSGRVVVSIKSKAVAAAVFVEKSFLDHHISNLTITRKKSLKGKLFSIPIQGKFLTR